MNDQCSLLKNKDSLYWAKQFSSNVIGYNGDNSQMAYSCNPYGTDPIMSCPNNGEFKYVKGDGCTTLIKGKAGIDVSNDTSIEVDLSTKPIKPNISFKLTPNAGIVSDGQPLGCGCKSDDGTGCLLNWPVTLSSNISATKNISIGDFPTFLPIKANFNINAGIEGETGWFPFPGNATKCERIAYNAPKLGCCLNKKDVVQVYNGIPYTCDVNTIHKYSIDCAASIADYCSTPDFFNFNGSSPNFDNRDFKEWLKDGKCFNYFNIDGKATGKTGNNNYDAMELVLNKSIPAINTMYPVDNPGGDIITTLTFPETGGFFQINYGETSLGGFRVNIYGSYEVNALVTNIQNQIDTNLGVNAITFGVIGDKFYLIPNQDNNKVMQIIWTYPYSDPATAKILGGGNNTGKFKKGQQYIFPNPYIGVSVSTGKQIWDNVAKAITTAKSGTNALKEICKNYTREDIETSYSLPPTEPNKKILEKICACNLSSNNYSNFGGKIPPSDYAVCDPLCLSSGSVPRFKSGTAQTCDNTNCIIDNTTINFIDSTSGDVTFNQVCKSGNGANCYFSDNNIFNQASKIGKVKVNQNCGRCFVYNPSSPFQPTEVNCLTGELPVTNKIWNYVVQLWRNHHWIIIGITITVIIIIILLIILRNISNKTLQTQNLLNTLKN